MIDLYRRVIAFNPLIQQSGELPVLVGRDDVANCRQPVDVRKHFAPNVRLTKALLYRSS